MVNSIQGSGSLAWGQVKKSIPPVEAAPAPAPGPAPASNPTATIEPSAPTTLTTTATPTITTAEAPATLTYQGPARRSEPAPEPPATLTDRLTAANFFSSDAPVVANEPALAVPLTAATGTPPPTRAEIVARLAYTLVAEASAQASGADMVSQLG